MNLARPPFPEENEPELLADWAELWAMSEKRPLSLGKLRTTLARESQSSETSAADTWSELQRRSAVFRAEWPLRFEDEELRVAPEASTLLFNYFMCALTFRYGIENETRRVFELCVRDVMRALTRLDVMHLGAPRIPHRPLKDVVADYCDASKEVKGDDPPLTDKDLGLDVAAWISFPDGRGSYLHFLGQCATGGNWEDKLTELCVNQWRDHVRWAFDPVRFFATPFVIQNDDFRRVSQAAGLVLDRPRLLHLSTLSPLSSETVEQVRACCRALY